MLGRGTALSRVVRIGGPRVRKVRGNAAEKNSAEEAFRGIVGDQPPLRVWRRLRISEFFTGFR